MSDIQTTGETLDTIQHDVSNSAESLSDVTGWVYSTTSTIAGVKNKRVVVGCLITCESNSIRFTFGSTPTNDAGTALGHVLTSGQSLKLTNHKQIRDFKFINKVSGSVATLQITPEISTR